MRSGTIAYLEEDQPECFKSADLKLSQFSNLNHALFLFRYRYSFEASLLTIFKRVLSIFPPAMYTILCIAKENTCHSYLHVILAHEFIISHEKLQNCSCAVWREFLDTINKSKTHDYQRNLLLANDIKRKSNAVLVKLRDNFTIYHFISRTVNQYNSLNLTFCEVCLKCLALNNVIRQAIHAHRIRWSHPRELCRPKDAEVNDSWHYVQSLIELTALHCGNIWSHL